MTYWGDDDDGDDGLPDDVFTELELESGVHHIFRTGDPNASSSGRKFGALPSRAGADGGPASSGETMDIPCPGDNAPLCFDTFDQASAWAKESAGRVFARASDGNRFEEKVAKALPTSSRSVPPPASSIPAKKWRQTDGQKKQTNELLNLSTHIHGIITDSNPALFRIWDIFDHFDSGYFEEDLKLCKPEQLARLRQILVALTEDMERELRRDWGMTPAEMARKGLYTRRHTAQRIKILGHAIAVLDVFSKVRCS